jgi:4-hydroxybenzoate polyprenyltransferase
LFPKKGDTQIDVRILNSVCVNSATIMKDIRYFFLLSRPVNVLITLLAFALATHIANESLVKALGDIQFWWACIALVVITGTGYWVNDAFDFKIDRENKPRKVIVNAHLSVKKVLTAYFFAVAFVLAFSLLVQPPVLFAVNAGAIVILFLYAWILKRTTVVGNIVIATLTGLVVYYAALLYVPRTALLWTIMFAFEVTFIREVVKDAEDIKGDLKFKLQTLPIRIGLLATKRVIFICYAVFVLSCYAPIAEVLFREQPLNWEYLVTSILFVQMPAVYMASKILKAETTADFSQQSKWLKFLIFAGMISVLFLI